MISNSKQIERHRKRADLLSGVGAVVLGVGIGALAARLLHRQAALILLVGIVINGWGMFDKHRLETKSDSVEPWSNALYWICWLLLGGLLLYVAARLR